jgi:hypothetical protein
MLEIKKINLNDRGIDKTFTITALPARAAIKLVREVIALCKDTELISAVVAHQFINNMLHTGEDVAENDPAKAEEELQRQQMLRQMMQMDTQTIITHLIKSVISGLTDEAQDRLIDKSLAYDQVSKSGVIYHNGEVEYSALDALNYNMIKDFTVVIDLIREVFVLNFSGAIDRLKKSQDQRTKTKISVATA